VVILSSLNHGSLCSVWCVVVCTSRLYLGMHSVADLVVGLILAVILFPPLVLFGREQAKKI
jgi:membrane-associated phospholipid phosphatase